MVHSELTHKERSFAATAGASATPGTTPPDTPSRRSSSAESMTNTSIALPRSAYYIIFVEGCERFCYYGLKAILLLYFMQFLKLSKDSATVGYHLFSSACYFTPTIGAIISDGFIGRYSTILILSVVYFVGTVILTITAVPQLSGRHLTGPVIGLGFIAVGTGGIKPCVSTFGADQISTANPKQLSRYFAFFYFAINCGSLVSTILTPILRSKVHCFGYDCYTLAFGVPALLMFISIVVFLAGTPSYKRVPPKENIIAKFFAIVFHALRKALFSRSSEKRSHWVEYADDKYSANDIEDVRSVLHVFLLFTPIPVYFALFDQSGSRWTYQASLMNGSLGGLGTIQPDQMQALNSLFVLLFIPLFEEVIYPMFARCNFLIRPLQRMFCGMLLMVFAFLVAALLQYTIQSRAETIPVRSHTHLFNGLSCPLSISQNRTVEVGQVLRLPCRTMLDEELVIVSTCFPKPVTFKLSPDQLCSSILIVSSINDEAQGSGMAITPLGNPISLKRPRNGYALLRLVSLDGAQTKIKTVPNNYEYEMSNKLDPTEYQPVLAKEYILENMINEKKSHETMEIWNTGVYTALVYNEQKDKLGLVLFEDIPPATVHILWQTIQYAILTCTEMLVCITGLIFAYSQSPRRYKSVIMSAWLMTTAVGDLIVVLVAEVRFVQDQALEFLLFAVLMAFAAFIFGVLAIQYREIKPDNSDSEDQQLILDRNAPEADDAIPLTN